MLGIAMMIHTYQETLARRVLILVRSGGSQGAYTMISIIDQRVYPIPAVAARMIPMIVPYFNNLTIMDTNFLRVHLIMVVIVPPFNDMRNI